ncbi:MAG: copper oxidase [Deltaproteobacteria bacterium]|nr:copper oxidase [Deltaproteobacteria bacterium]
MDRRTFVNLGGAVAAATLLTRSRDADAQEHAGHGGPPPPASAGAQPPPAPAVPPPPARQDAPRVVAPGGQRAVVTPNGSTLPWRVVRGVKVGHLIVHPFENEFVPGLRAECWGYNGSTPGPTIEGVEGDRVRIYVTNRLPEPTTVHWHGLIVPNGMDGVSGLNQSPIPPGETYVYEFTLRHAGTFMYHSHHDEMIQIALGCVGMFVVHPRVPRGPHVDHDFVLMSHEWRIDAGTRRPNPLEMTDFNVLTFNGKSFPATEPLLVGKGDRVRIRLGNLGPMSHHPIHLHGASFSLTATDSGFVPAAAWHPENTVLVPVGSTRVIEFVPDEAGDWALHCHMTHHVMTQMGHGVPNMVGANTRALDARIARIAPSVMTMGTVGMGGMGEMGMPVPENSAPMRGSPGPFSYIDMGGMFTVVKVRENPQRADAAGWYQHPRGTVAGAAGADRLSADGIDPNRPV